MNCPKCGTPLENGAAFCKKCGAPVPKNDTAVKKRFCTHCGVPLEPGATVCAACGAPVDAPVTPAGNQAPAPAAYATPAAAPAAQKPAQNGGHKGLAIGGIAVAAVLLLAVGGVAAVRLLGGSGASAEVPVASSAAEQTAESVLAESAMAQGTDAQQAAEPEPTQKAAAAEWVVEPTIEADNIEVMLQGEPDQNTYGDAGVATESGFYNTILRQYTYPLCAYTKDGKTGIIQYDGTLLAACNYNFYYVGNQEQLLVGNEFFGDTPAKHDMWLVTDTGVAGEPYYGSSDTCATVFRPDGWGVLAWCDAVGLGTFGEGGLVCSDRDPENATGPAMLFSSLDGWTIMPDANSVGYFYSGEGSMRDFMLGTVPLYNGQRVGTEVYEDVTPYTDGLFGVKKDGKWGYIDATGRYIFPCEYDSTMFVPDARSFAIVMENQEGNANNYAYTPSDGYLVLCKGGQYALYTKAGEEVIPFGEYEALRPVCGGKLWAKQGGKWGVLALAGATSAPTALTAPALPGDTPEPDPAQSSASEYIFPDSDTRYLTDADLRGLDATTLRIARNEILARHGRLFDSADLQAHFNACSWYNGTIAPSSFSMSVLNTVELANIELIKAYE